MRSLNVLHNRVKADLPISNEERECLGIWIQEQKVIQNRLINIVFILAVVSFLLLYLCNPN